MLKAIANDSLISGIFEMKIIPEQHLITADVANKNNRIYPKALLEKLVVKHSQKEGVGTVGYPEWLPDELFGTVPLDKIAFAWSNLRLVENNLLADIKILPTPEGQKLEQLMSESEFGFRTFGVSTLDKENIIGDDYQLIGLAALPLSQCA